MAHEAQVRYSNLVDLKLRATLVKKVGVICNNHYEGSPKAGSVKVPVRDTEVSVNDYNKQTGAEKTHGDTAYLTVAINKDKAVNEIIDGFDAESVPGQLVADRLDSAGYSLALQADTDGSVELTTAPKRSLSAPSARRATASDYNKMTDSDISIHALREEGDLDGLAQLVPDGLFLSTPSARRATADGADDAGDHLAISIHALREEGDPDALRLICHFVRKVLCKIRIVLDKVIEVGYSKVRRTGKGSLLGQQWLLTHLTIRIFRRTGRWLASILQGAFFHQRPGSFFVFCDCKV